MSASTHLSRYAEGWTRGDASLILGAAAPDFYFDDPNVGVVPRSGFAAYLAEMRETVKSLLDGQLPEPFMELSEVHTMETEDGLTAWCWWQVPGTPIKGGGLIKVSAAGVRSEVITYYTRLVPKADRFAGPEGELRWSGPAGVCAVTSDSS